MIQARVPKGAAGSAGGQFAEQARLEPAAVILSPAADAQARLDAAGKALTAARKEMQNAALQLAVRTVREQYVIHGLRIRSHDDSSASWEIRQTPDGEWVDVYGLDEALDEELNDIFWSMSMERYDMVDFAVGGDQVEGHAWPDSVELDREREVVEAIEFDLDVMEKGV